MTKSTLFFFGFCFMLVGSAFGQLKKDGTPDMRYNANKNTYYVPAPKYAVPTYTAPTQSVPNADVTYQNSYTKTDGTIVDGHFKTNSNGTNVDNFSTTPNTNPYTGTTGTKAQDYSTGASNYGSGNQIMTGSKGGQYYINTNGNKTYVPKK